jgi:hypothetical protein
MPHRCTESLADKQIGAQKPPNFLDRMQSTYLKQVAYNQRIMKAEEEISGINCDVADFVSQMSLDPAEEVVIYVNGSQEMKKGERAMAGQLWIQGDRMMTASNPAFDQMSNTRESAVLSAAAEAIAWKNEALEAPGPRKGPKDLPHLETVLISGDPNADPEDGHPIAYQRVLAAAAEFENPPIFLKEDCDAIIRDPVKAEAVPKWMCVAERIATGSRPRVLEDGPDTIHSDEDAEEDVEADKELGMYAPGVDPKVLSKAEVARQLAAARAIKSQALAAESSCSESDNPDGFDMRYSHSRKTFVKNAAKDLSDSEVGNSFISSPVSSSTSTRPPTLTEEHQRLVEGAKKRVLVPRSPSAENVTTQRKGKSATRSRAVADSQTSGLKASPGTADAIQPKGTKVPPPTKEQQAPKHPIQTRDQDGSRAGGFRPGVGGSGQTDTRVASSHPSQT